MGPRRARSSRSSPRSRRRRPCRSPPPRTRPSRRASRARPRRRRAQARRARACLDDLDALLRACAADDGSRRADRDDAPGGGAPAAASDDASASLSLLAKAHFLRAEILLLDGAWDAAARAALDASSDGIAPPGGIGVASRVAAFRRRVSATRARSPPTPPRTSPGAATSARSRPPPPRSASRARAASLYLLRAKTAVRLDLHGVAVADVADFLRLDPTSRSRPAALATLAEALRRSARTTDALATAARVPRDCLRVDPDAEECREPLASATRLLALHENATALEEAREWDDAADAWRAFRQADDEKLFGLEQEAGSCRAESFAARKAAGLFDSDSPRGDGRSFLFGEEDERGNGGKEGASSFKHVPPLAFPAAARAKAESAIRRCGSAAPALEAAASDGVAGEGAVRAAVALARNRVDRGWARLVRGDADAARSDAESARRALDDVARFLPAGGEEGDDAGGDAAARETETTLGSPETADASSRFSLDFSQDFFSGGANAGEPWASYAAAASASSLVADARRGAARLARAAKALAEALEPKDLYAVLGLTRDDASRPDWLAVLKRAYRRLALMFHPDKNPEDPEAASARFLDVSEAYKILANDDLRRRYDETGDPGVDRGFDRGGGFSRGARASAGPAGDSRRFDRAWLVSVRPPRRRRRRLRAGAVDAQDHRRGGGRRARRPRGERRRPVGREGPVSAKTRVPGGLRRRRAEADAERVRDARRVSRRELERREERRRRDARGEPPRATDPRGALRRRVGPRRGAREPRVEDARRKNRVPPRGLPRRRRASVRRHPRVGASGSSASGGVCAGGGRGAHPGGPRRARDGDARPRPRCGRRGGGGARRRDAGPFFVFVFVFFVFFFVRVRGPSGTRARARGSFRPARRLWRVGRGPRRRGPPRGPGGGAGARDGDSAPAPPPRCGVPERAERLGFGRWGPRRVRVRLDRAHEGRRASRRGARREPRGAETRPRAGGGGSSGERRSGGGGVGGRYERPVGVRAVGRGRGLGPGAGVRGAAGRRAGVRDQVVRPRTRGSGRSRHGPGRGRGRGRVGRRVRRREGGVSARARTTARRRTRVSGRGDVGRRAPERHRRDRPVRPLGAPGRGPESGDAVAGRGGVARARRIALPGAWRGKRIRRWMVACERDGPARTKVWIRNVRVVGADGEEAHVALASEGKPREVWDEEEEEEDGFGFGGGGRGSGEEW